MWLASPPWKVPSVRSWRRCLIKQQFYIKKQQFGLKQCLKLFEAFPWFFFGTNSIVSSPSAGLLMLANPSFVSDSNHPILAFYLTWGREIYILESRSTLYTLFKKMLYLLLKRLFHWYNYDNTNNTNNKHR